MRNWQTKQPLHENKNTNNIYIDVLFYLLILTYCLMILIPLILWVELINNWNGFDWIFR